MNIGDMFKRHYVNELVYKHGISSDQADLLLTAFGGLAVLLNDEQAQALLTMPRSEVMRLGAEAKAAQDARIADEYEAG